jgi:hypothetical protein
MVGLVFKKGEQITFNFLGMICTGTIIDPNIEDNTIRVNYNGTVHRVGLTEKDNKFCFLYDNES